MHNLIGSNIHIEGIKGLNEVKACDSDNIANTRFFLKKVYYTTLKIKSELADFFKEHLAGKEVLGSSGIIIDRSRHVKSIVLMTNCGRIEIAVDAKASFFIGKSMP